MTFNIDGGGKRLNIFLNMKLYNFSQVCLVLFQTFMSVTLISYFR